MTTDVAHEQRMAVIAKYARPNQRGEPMQCQPSRQEKSTGRYKASPWKIIYDDEATARAVAKELMELPDVRQLYVYACPRSKTGHYHLTSRK